MIQSIHSLDLVESYYKDIHNVIGGCIDDNQLWLVKREGWTVAIAHIEFFYSREGKERISKVLMNLGYKNFVAASLSKVTDYAPILVIPSTVSGIDEFRIDYCSWYWYVFFAGEPDWFILPAQTLDFIIVAGKKDFVEQLLGCSLEEASMDIQEMAESENFETSVCKYYAHLLKQIQTVYPEAETETVVNLGLLEWED